MSELDAATHGQVNSTAAEVYEDFFVPALFGQWPDVVLDRAGLAPDDDVLDVGCGTGILARAAARRVGAGGSATGIDVNEGMLAVAGRAPEPVTWRHGSAEELPFDDRSFDRVISQFALMFFADQAAGLREMTRVARPGGTITIATWASLEESPGYEAMVGLLRRLFGEEAARALEAPFVLGTEEDVRELVEPVSAEVTVTHHGGTARFESLEAWVHTDVRGWTLADMIDDDQYSELLSAARTELAPFVRADGQVRFPAPALIATAAV